MTAQMSLGPSVTLSADPQRRQVQASQWHTPDDLARRLVEWCGRPPRGWRILEPSAGSGALVRPWLDGGGLALAEPSQITACEIDPQWAAHLRATCHGVAVEECDYLQRPAPSKPYDLAVMNPPYEGGADSLFVAKAMAESMRVIALVRSAFLHGKTRHERVWSHVEARRWRLVGIAYLVARPSFAAAGEASGTPLSDFVAIKLTKGVMSDPRTSVEWW